MFDAVMFDKICSVSCSDKELRGFNCGLDRREFDMDNAFDKYFSLDSIIKCIDLYKSGKVSDIFVSYWACAYNWIIMAGFRGKDNDENEKDVSLDTLIRWEISDWLDGLSFYDKECETKDLLGIDDFREAFCSLDRMYKNIDSFTAFYSYTGEFYDNGCPIEDAFILLINHEGREFLFYRCDGCDFRECRLDGTLCEEKKLFEMMDDLKRQGYEKIILGKIFEE